MVDEAKNTASSENYDIFIANELYPDAEAIFGYQPKMLDEVKKDCIVILDTNTLLVPYTVSRNSLDQIKQIYKRLVRQKRLVIPGQVAREFAKNRAIKISELYSQLTRKKNSKPHYQGAYPLLEPLNEYQDAMEIEKQIDALERQYATIIDKVIERVRNWTWNDPVSQLYNDLFAKDVINDPVLDKAQIKTDLLKRQVHKLPPGYKDASKEDQGIGDLLIWHTILNIGMTQKKSVIFVSGDEKADWWYQSEGQALYPRFELIDEFRRASENQTIHIIKFSHLLEIFGADQVIVDEVRKEELQWAYEEEFARLSKERYKHYRTLMKIAEMAVHKWLVQKYPGCEILISPFEEARRFDFTVRLAEGEELGVDVKFFRQFTLTRIRDTVFQYEHAAARSPATKSALIVFVLENQDFVANINRIKQDLNRIKKEQFSNLRFVVGYLNPDREFVEIESF